MEDAKVYAIAIRGGDYWSEPFLYVLSYANPANPVEITHKEIGSGAALAKADDLLINGDYIYYVDSYDMGLEILNKATLLTHAQLYFQSFSNAPFSMTLKNGYVYAAVSTAIYVLDVTDADQPITGNHVDILAPADQTRAVEVSGDYLYTVTPGDGVRIFDTTAEANPVQVAADLESTGVHRLTHQGSYIYVASDTGVLCYLFD